MKLLFQTKTITERRSKSIFAYDYDDDNQHKADNVIGYDADLSSAGTSPSSDDDDSVEDYQYNDNDLSTETPMMTIPWLQDRACGLNHQHEDKMEEEEAGEESPATSRASYYSSSSSSSSPWERNIFQRSWDQPFWKDDGESPEQLVEETVPDRSRNDSLRGKLLSKARQVRDSLRNNKSNIFYMMRTKAKKKHPRSATNVRDEGESKESCQGSPGALAIPQQIGWTNAQSGACAKEDIILPAMVEVQAPKEYNNHSPALGKSSSDSLRVRGAQVHGAEHSKSVVSDPVLGIREMKTTTTTTTGTNISTRATIDDDMKTSTDTKKKKKKVWFDTSKNGVIDPNAASETSSSYTLDGTTKFLLWWSRSELQAARIRNARLMDYGVVERPNDDSIGKMLFHQIGPSSESSKFANTTIIRSSSSSSSSIGSKSPLYHKGTGTTTTTNRAATFQPRGDSKHTTRGPYCLLVI